MGVKAIIGQSGGPTAVINASLVGLVEGLRAAKLADTVLGLEFGIQGLMEERFFDLGAQPAGVLGGLLRSPSSALGSSRYKVKDEDLPRILSILKRHEVRYFFLIGGNDTMDTIDRVERYCRQQGYELVGVGVPKTVDNDLFGTDHTPGYPSAARSCILDVLQAGTLARDMRRVDSFVVYQTVGRDAGWLASATALARRRPDDAPHLVYVPERPFAREEFLADAKAVVDRLGWVSIVCGEGIRYADGTPVSASTARDGFSNTEFGAMGGASAALRLHAMLREEFGWRGEFQIPESLVMSDWARSEPADYDEARRCGHEAVALAARGEGGRMVTLERVMHGKAYEARFGSVPLKEVAVHARPMPPSYLEAGRPWPSAEFLEYARPLISPLPEFARLEPLYHRA